MWSQVKVLVGDLCASPCGSSGGTLLASPGLVGPEPHYWLCFALEKGLGRSPYHCPSWLMCLSETHAGACFVADKDEAVSALVGLKDKCQASQKWAEDVNTPSLFHRSAPVTEDQETRWVGNREILETPPFFEMS